MKKILVLVASFVLVLALSACGGGDEVVNHPPGINGVVETVVINKGDAYDPLAGVYAIDEEDGDLTDDLEVQGTYDTDTQGSYTFNVIVEDSDGEVSSVGVNLTVNDPLSTNESPVLNGIGEYLFIIGETFDASSLGITATDTEDGDLTASITIDESTLDLTVVGFHYVTYFVTDSLGVQAVKTVAIRVFDGGDNPRDTRFGASDTLIIGSSELSGNFVSGFGSSAYDNWVINLVNGAEVIATTIGGEFVENTNILDSSTAVYEEVTTNPNLTYTFTIRDDMKFSDGSPIMASDYVFSAKLQASAVFTDVGGAPNFIDIVGFEEWNAGCVFEGYRLPANATEAAAGYDTDTGAFDPSGWTLNVDPAHADSISFYPEVTDMWGDPLDFPPTPLGCDTTHNYTTTPLDFAGVKLISDYSFSMTIKGNRLPYFYLLAMVAVNPYSEAAYTKDGTYGFLTATEIDALTTSEIHLGDYIKGEFLSNPSISTGAYVFVDYVPGEYAQLELNPLYAGDYRGHKATIENVYIRVVPMATDMEHLVTGEIDLLPGVVEGDKINQGRGTDYLAPVTFLRNGYGMIAFATDFGPVSDYRVRQAIAYLIDRATFVDAFLDGWGSTVDGPYGLGQWMLQESSTVPDDLIHYTVDLTKARALLDDAGWEFESDGTTTYVQGTNTVRYNSDGEPLDINWLGTVGEYSDLLGPILIAGMSEVGINLNATQADFGTLLDNYYYAYTMDVEDRQYHMFNLATTFGTAFDPYNSYHSDWLGTWQNSNQLSDTPSGPAAPLETGEKTIDEITVLMRELDPSLSTSHDLFLEYWEMYIFRMNKLLPNIPLYSNEYHHFVNSQIKGFDASVFWDWTQSIVDMTILMSD